MVVRKFDPKKKGDQQKQVKESSQTEKFNKMQSFKQEYSPVEVQNPLLANIDSQSHAFIQSSINKKSSIKPYLSKLNI
jgi:hypothetical protein